MESISPPYTFAYLVSKVAQDALSLSPDTVSTYGQPQHDTEQNGIIFTYRGDYPKTAIVNSERN